MSNAHQVGHFKRIPVVTEPRKPSRRLHWQRRTFQLGFIALLLLIPISGLFRIDPVDGAFVVLDRQIWFSDFFIVFGFWIAVASALVLTYSMLGTAFCGWACPQNTLSEWANNLNRRLLGKRAEVALDGAKMKVASAKNNMMNWLAFVALLLIASMFFALIPMFYFYTPDAVWSFVTLRQDDRLAGSLHYIYSIFVLIIFLNVAFIRHFLCRFMCIYKVWQHSFKTKQTLHVAHDKSRAEACTKCNLCVTTCFIGLDPRNTDTYDTCINCGECIDACNNLQARKGEAGLLRFEVGESQQAKLRTFRTNLGSFLSRVRWTIPFTVLGSAMFVWGIMVYQPHHMSVYKAESNDAAVVSDYRINVVNKLYRPAHMTVSVTGLEDSAYTLSATELAFDSVGRKDVVLHVKPALNPGVHPLMVHVTSENGWSRSHRVQHFVAHDESTKREVKP